MLSIQKPSRNIKINFKNGRPMILNVISKFLTRTKNNVSRPICNEYVRYSMIFVHKRNV